MKVVTSALFEEDLKTLLDRIGDPAEAKRFKLYLDTVLLNLPTKAEKYKPSRFFDDENIRDIVHQGLVVPFYFDEKNRTCVVLGIIDNYGESAG